MNAVIIAVGTELTTGQITNRNAAWISERLQPYGVEVLCHLTVPDEEGAIWQALERASRDAELLVVTGGLGPTSDDFTRDVIAKWAGLELVYDEASWSRIVDRLGRLGVPVAESNRQQCYYPEGYSLLRNDQGTANGFALKRGATRLWAFPGPPRELESVWKNGVAPMLESGVFGGRARRLVTYGCIGRSEAEIGEIVNRALEESGLEVGFRAHAPYVEVKIWVPEAEWTWKEGYLLRVEAALGSSIVQRDGEDFALTFVERALARFERVVIEDFATCGLLTKRLSSVLESRGLEEASRFQMLSALISADRDSRAAVSDACAALEPSGKSRTLLVKVGPETTEGQWDLRINLGESEQASVERIPFPKTARTPRSRAFIAEMSLKKALDFLSASP